MTIHNIFALLVFLAFAYSVYFGIKAIVTLDKGKSVQRGMAFLITIIGVLYLAESMILFFKGDSMVIHPLGAIISTLSVAVNLIAINTTNPEG